MITQEQIPEVLEHPVYDAQGKKVGDAKHVFFDDATGRPEWVTVKTGLFGTHESFVPIREASLVEDHVEVPYPKDKIKDAPNVDVDNGGHLSEDEEHRLYDYYGIDWDQAWQQAEQRGAGGGYGTADTAGTAGMAGAAGMAGLGAERNARQDMDTGRGTDARQGMTDESARTLGRDDAMTRSEERMHIGAERYPAGRARLRKYVVVEDVEGTVPLRHEEVRVVREPITEGNVDDALSGPEIAEAEYEVTLYAEQPVVEIETVPVERVRMTTEELTEEETITGQVRKERIEADGVAYDEDDDLKNRRPGQ
ncbi:PRC and DUF2382 domain-containing protein [Streptomyces sp. NPDC059786]|uniref:PRC and DUF2382 domain-containing protein n=1 Tax=Streptomyces sp. NPDC059786 TaxID=3346946 RepID=UPI003659BAC9